MRRVSKTTWATLALLLCNACGKDDAGTTPTVDVGFADAVTPPVGGGGGGGDSGGPTETHLRLSYTKEVAPKDNSPGSVDLVIYDFEDNREANLTQGSPDIDCRSKGCTLNRSMTWVAWLAREEGVGFALWIAPVDTQRLRVNLDTKRRIADQVLNFEFTNDGVRDLVVYQRGVAEGPEGMLEVRVEPVVQPDAGLCANGSPPDDISACPTLLGNVNGSGSFRVTPFGALVILIRTTLSTMSLDFYNVRNGANQTLYTFGDQGGTGSEFSGRQPIALSPDAEYLAATTKNGGVWKLHNLVAAPSPPVPTNVELFEVQRRGSDCQRPAPFNYNTVAFDPRFSPDGDYIYFLATGNCSIQAGTANRTDTDVLRVNREVGAASVVSVTKNARANHWSNHEISDFDISPDGTKLAFSAPRQFDSESRSIWIIDPNPDAENAPVFDCSRTTAGLEPMGLDGKKHCEFLSEERANAHVRLRDLRFHQVEVSAN